jgi:hypothetical protein
MSATVAITGTFNMGGARMTVGTVTMDATYPAGGEPVTKAALTPGNGSFLQAMFFPNAGYVPEYIASTQKLMVYEGDYSPAAVGPLTENATADISACVFPFVAFARA